MGRIYLGPVLVEGGRPGAEAQAHPLVKMVSQQLPLGLAHQVHPPEQQKHFVTCCVHWYGCNLPIKALTKNMVGSGSYSIL